MNWLRNNWRHTAFAITAAAAIAVGVIWPSVTPTSDPARPLLIGKRHDSYNYLMSNAQGWLTAPAAATTTYRWKMNESSGNITDDLSGTSAVLTTNGSPAYRVFTPIPVSAPGAGNSGFVRTAIGFTSAATEWFAAADNVAADQTTNNFSGSIWFCNSVTPAANQYLISKRTGNTGYSVFLDTSNRLNIEIGDGTLASGLVSAALSYGCHLATVKWDRATTATADVDGQATGVTVDISARSGSVTSAVPFTIGRLASGGNVYIGRIAEVLIANGTITTAEHTALYKAFKVPSDVTYVQTTTRKWPCGTDALGQRLCTIGGSSTNPQWPVMVDSTLINSSSNPSGTAFPSSGAVTNIIGHANAFDQWITTGMGGVVADKWEAPDGSLTADEFTYTANAQQVRTTPVGAGVIAAGDRWTFSVYYRRISGSCTGIILYGDGGGNQPWTYLTNATTWTRAAMTTGTASYAAGKFAGIYAVTHGNCVLAVADAMYVNNSPTAFLCTSVTGAVSQTCNASYYSQIIPSTKSAYQPLAMSRGEVDIVAAVSPFVHSANSARYLWTTGDTAIQISEGLQPTFVLKNQGGQVESAAKGRPIGHTTEKRHYVASWNTATAEGLTNTSPRRYAALQLNDKYQQTILDPRNYNATSQIPSVATNQRDSLSTTIFVGCDQNGANCYNGAVEKAEWYARPAQEVRVADTSQLVVADFTGSSFVQAQANPRFETPAGATTANTWIWDTSELSGSLYDRNNGVALTPTGSPRYQVWSGLLARGNGRRGVNFDLAGSESVKASGTSIADIAAGTVITIDAAVRTSALTTTQAIVGSASISSNTAGYVLYFDSTGFAKCCVDDGTNKSCRISSVALDVNWHFYTCVATKAVNWSVALYVDGIVSTGASTTAATGSIANANAVIVGSSAAGTAYPLNGQIGEIRIEAGTTSSADALTRYKNLVQTGSYISTTALAHWKMNEAAITNGVGLKDHSGNGNHLTVVTAIPDTPDPQYAPMPWPAGSGMNKPAVECTGNAVNWFTGGAGSGLYPNADQPFSFSLWWRAPASTTGALYIMYKTAVNPYFVAGSGTLTEHYCRFYNSLGGAAAAVGSAAARSNWTLFNCKLVPEAANTYRVYASTNGEPFIAGEQLVGTVAGNDNAILLGRSFAAGETLQIAGLMIIKDYALTDADVAAYYKAGTSPVSNLVYARTNKACYVVGDHAIDGSQVRCFNANEVPFSYDSSLLTVPGNERMGLGQPVHAAVTNIALQSEDAATTWAATNVTVATNSTASPDGMLTADTVSSTAGAGDLRQVFGTIAAVTHTYCQWLKRNQATDVAGFVRLVTNSTGVQIAQTAFTATSKWQQFCVSGTATLNDTRVETQITVLGDSVFWWGAHLSADSAWPRVYCPTTTASVTCNATSSNYIAAANLTGWDRVEGVIAASAYTTNATAYIMDLHNGANLNGAIRILAPTTEALLYNSAGVLQQRIGFTNAQINTMTNAKVIYDSQETFYTDPAGTARRSYGITHQSNYAGVWPTYTVDTSNSWTHGSGTNLYLGLDNAGANSINGILQNISIYKTR